MHPDEAIDRNVHHLIGVVNVNLGAQVKSFGVIEAIQIELHIWKSSADDRLQFLEHVL